MAIKDIKNKTRKPSLVFSDVFAGCGGISLGLVQAGWKGKFAIEKNANAFETLKTNLVGGHRRGFSWPDWLPKKALSTTELLHSHADHLVGLKGQITLLAGGPPCQGFSLAGRRTQADPRNSLTEDYINIVQKLEPRFLLIENVQGFMLPFKKHGSGENREIPYSQRVRERLEEIGYKVYSKLIDLAEYGVPQTRTRFIIIAIRSDDRALKKLKSDTPFDLLEKRRKRFLAGKKLPTDRPITTKEAIGDLEVRNKELVSSTDYEAKGFKQISKPDSSFDSPFVSLMRNKFAGTPDSLRLPNHKESTILQFQEIIDTCPSGKKIPDAHKKRLGIKKHAITPLSPHMPSATITTLPDDMIHYSEPRILTVRENARLQTFPDWFEFTGKYTTGGKARKSECPRYTQVGNAVPPLFSEAIGRILKELAA
jgi:DNA (cytosine-5)-methyltransferase 1